MAGPLSDVRILDLTRLLPGGFCTLLLGDLGADVLAELHHGAHERCFLAASVNFPVEVAGS